MSEKRKGIRSSCGLPPSPRPSGPANELVSESGEIRDKSEPERHASAVSDALERIEWLEDTVERLGQEITLHQWVHSTPPPGKETRDGRTPRPDPSVRAPFNRLSRGDWRRIYCQLCRLKHRDVANVGNFAICDGCVSKLEAALGVGG